MSAIDQVIARARQGEVGFAERKQFKLARRRAIEKLRRFALADPYFYIREIIQAAIAGGADSSTSPVTRATCGTPGGTARMVVRAWTEQVDVGRAEGELAGTYVRARKLNRAKVAAETGRNGDDDGGLEYATVELRCLTAPVPVVINGQSLFGWSTQRVPNFYG